MQYRDIPTKYDPQPPREDRRQGYLRNEHQRRTAGIERSSHRAYVNLRLAAARYAVQKKRGIPAGSKTRFYRGQYLRLIRIECQISEARQIRFGQRISKNLLRHDL